MQLISELKFPSLLCIVAGIVYIWNFKELRGIEKLILLIILLNILADIYATYLSLDEITNGYVYNILSPIERIITIMIYAFNSRIKRDRRINYIGIGMVIVVSIGGVIYYPKFVDFHNGIFVLSGLLVAALSYYHLRAIVLDKADQSILIFAFSLANLVYFTTMISSMSALPVAYRIKKDFAMAIGYGNLIAYALWSIILITGILWKRQKT